MMTIWKYEGREWNHKTQRNRWVRFWCVRVADRVWEGFGTRAEAKAYGEAQQQKETEMITGEYRVIRTSMDGDGPTLGVLRSYLTGWRFFPSKGLGEPGKMAGTPERACPKWVAYPDGCRSELV